MECEACAAYSKVKREEWRKDYNERLLSDAYAAGHSKQGPTKEGVLQLSILPEFSEPPSPRTTPEE